MYVPYAVVLIVQYIRECVAKEKVAMVCIRHLQSLLPEKKDEFIRPVFSGESSKLSSAGTYSTCSICLCTE